MKEKILRVPVNEFKAFKALLDVYPGKPATKYKFREFVVVPSKSNFSVNPYHDRWLKAIGRK